MNLLFDLQKEKASVLTLIFPEVSSEKAATHPDQAAGEDFGVVDALRLEATRMADLSRARDEGYAAGLAEGEHRRKQDLDIERSAVSHLCLSFANERKRYFAEVETEVVKLALAIAARVLQRESAIDPTLLKGVVKVALMELGDAKGVVLRMHAEDLEAWNGAIKHSGLELVGDASMTRGDLQIEVDGSVAELGVTAQLVEVERGFFDLMARRPA